MHGLLSIDSAISSRVCLTLVHSLWQVALFMIVAETANWLLPRPTARRRHAMLTLALMLSLIAVPVTYEVLAVGSHTVPSVTSTPPSRAVDSLLASARPATLVRPRVTVAGQGGEFVTAAPKTGLGAIDGAPFTRWLVGFYALGVGFMLTRLAFGLERDRRARQNVRLISSGRAFDELQRLCLRGGVRCAPLLAQMDTLAVPILLGIFRPVIVLPTAALSGLTAKEIEMILAHELSHLHRGDVWVNMLQRFAESVLFFNPPVWLLSRRISAVREFRCDDEACDATESQPAIYAGLLIRLAESATRRHCHGDLRVLAVTGSRPSELRRRVARLLGEPIRQPLRLTRRCVLTAASAVAMLTFGSLVWPVHAQTDNQEQGATERAVPTGSMTRRFENSGVVVELLGIGNHDPRDRQWWDDTGQRLNDVKFAWEDTAKVNVSPADAISRSVAIRIYGRPQSAYVTWRLTAVGLGGSGSQRLNWTGVDAPDNVLARFFTISDDRTKSFDIPVGIAAGPWKPVASASKGSGGAMGNRGHSLVFSRGFEVDGVGSVIVSHDYFDDDIRVVAYDKAGKVHPQQGRGGSSAGKIYQCQATFPGLPLDQIDRFEFQTRTYEWVRFDDLPLNPK